MEKKKVRWYSYVILAITIIILSGVFKSSDTPLKALDFNNLLGNYGTLGTVEEGSKTILANDFKGIGGTGPKDGILLVISVAPAIIMAFGLIEICVDYKGLDAAEVIFNPLTKPILGLPGSTAIALVTSLTSSDAAAGMTKSLADEKYLNEKQRIILTSFQMLAPSILINFFAMAPTLEPFIDKPLTIALLVILIMKFIGTIISRILIKFLYKEEVA